MISVELPHYPQLLSPYLTLLWTNTVRVKFHWAEQVKVEAMQQSDVVVTLKTFMWQVCGLNLDQVSCYFN
jgi:hypothetical protein